MFYFDLWCKGELAMHLKLGINHLDTADVYSDGHSERMISQFLQEIPRDGTIIHKQKKWPVSVLTASSPIRFPISSFRG
ncbi:aldo/keto reductase [Paenibacillus sp. Soil522]|uniref:aldo/keto reductase n=1 Tax=Paenibacillus sp. Soil522 TaxID=1736388 RepID=UPI0012DC35B9